MVCRERRTSRDCEEACLHRVPFYTSRDGDKSERVWKRGDREMGDE